MKKKVLTVALAAVLLTIMVTGTLAYFAEEDEATNTFTLGSIEIEIYENGQSTPEDKMTFGKLIPILDPSDPGSDDNYIAKVVEVKNTGINNAYIRTHLAIPTQLVDYLHLDLNETGWTRQSNTTATVAGVAYTVYTYDYDIAVVSGEFTNDLLRGVYLGSDVDLEENAAGNLVFIRRDENGGKIHDSGFVAHTKNANGGYTSVKVNVLVAAEAIQDRGFTDGAAALNSGFGTNTNPWQ